ncbi:hypothetical protein MRB53_042312 [Persea americana]|nr:hypothetical protein MRB53_042312 [Persea americana]
MREISIEELRNVAQGLASKYISQSRAKQFVPDQEPHQPTILREINAALPDGPRLEDYPQPFEDSSVDDFEIPIDYFDRPMPAEPAKADATATDLQAFNIDTLRWENLGDYASSLIESSSLDRLNEQQTVDLEPTSTYNWPTVDGCRYQEPRGLHDAEASTSQAPARYGLCST